MIRNERTKFSNLYTKIGNKSNQGNKNKLMNLCLTLKHINFLALIRHDCCPTFVNLLYSHKPTRLLALSINFNISPYS